MKKKSVQKKVQKGPKIHTIHNTGTMLEQPMLEKK